MFDFFESWTDIESQVRRADHVLLMLDFDGTLAPIVRRPADARIPAATRSHLEALVGHPRTAVAFVSGRDAGDVRQLTGIAEAHYFGSHGRQRIRPGSEAIELDGRYVGAVRNACEEIGAALADVAGFSIENKTASAAAHFRNVEADLQEAAQARVQRIVDTHPLLAASSGKKVLDIVPLDGVDKGVAVNRLHEEVGGLPFYFGDDRTDEAAFEALAPPAVTAFVGPAGRPSAARYRLDDPSAVGEALGLLLRSLG